ncbi:hypothetical protein A9P82_03000 [Arachidicoccus ginsenosidimutans]|uniref:DUF2975 domain-containing protein n=1 Tax=Arachidicoccus sp. BS20 TaxID=1850526 RepID=UPI0007F15885|nr:DUF2975 domain-containing protein [Arachidicoccus sp. BS20]ANI88358.1 hypothetical protein A9P82_03000 [Arachidicoccus sp. BS20]
MKPPFVFRFLKTSINVLYYFMISVCILFVVAALIKTAVPDKSFGDFGFGTDKFDVISFSHKQESSFIYSVDTIVRYRQPENNFSVQVKMNSGMGLYVLSVQFFSLILAVIVLGIFRKIFKEMDLGNPFNYKLIRRLRSLALFFVIIDILKLINYFIFNFLLYAHLPDQHFALSLSIGTGLVIGAIIWLISIIFQRGLELQQDKDLTI